MPLHALDLIYEGEVTVELQCLLHAMKSKGQACYRLVS